MIAGKRILYVTHRFPFPPTGGARVRAYHSIRHLAANNEVTVAAPLRDAEETAAVAGLAAEGVEVLAAPISRMRAVVQSLAHAATGRPASMGYFRAPRLVRRVARWIAERSPDLVVVHCSSVAPWVARVPLPKVLDFVDMDSEKWRDYASFAAAPKSFVYRREAGTLARAEARLARAFDLSLVTTEFERESLRAIAGDVPAMVVRNGVDLDYFRPLGGEYDPHLLCFVGRMDYLPNARAMIRFCREVMPRIRSALPQARLRIVGAAPGPDVRALAALPGIEVTGTVDDVRPHVGRAALTVAPLTIARGTQNKVLESMAMGVPVVASALAARGVDMVPGEHLLVADAPADLAEAVLSLLNDGGKRKALARAALERVTAVYPWSESQRAFEEALSRVLDGRAALHEERALG